MKRPDSSYFVNLARVLFTLLLAWPSMGPAQTPVEQSQYAFCPGEVRPEHRESVAHDYVQTLLQDSMWLEQIILQLPQTLVQNADDLYRLLAGERTSKGAWLAEPLPVEVVLNVEVEGCSTPQQQEEWRQAFTEAFSQLNKTYPMLDLKLRTHSEPAPASPYFQ